MNSSPTNGRKVEGRDPRKPENAVMRDRRKIALTVRQHEILIRSEIYAGRIWSYKFKTVRVAAY